MRLRLPMPGAEVEALARRVASELGWAVEDSTPGRLTLAEDATKLHCHCQPLRAELSYDEGAPDATELRIEGRVPGWGPISSEHARRQTDLLTRRIGLTVAARSL